MSSKNQKAAGSVRGIENMGFHIDGMCFSYENREVLRDISLGIEAGHFYGIAGPNGCGKTTFVDLLMGHKLPSSGTITYNGRTLSSYSRKELAREIALVPQNFYINFPFTAGEVVMMGRYPYMSRFSPPSSEDMGVVNAVMEQTGTEKFINRYMTELSGGERQRVVFARALVQDTPVLMLDEATSNLDINHTLNLLDFVLNRGENHKKTVIAVVQDINLAAMYCDRMIFMKHGNIAACGDTQNVLTEETIKTVFDVESNISFDPYSNSRKVSFRRIVRQ